jgi:hypothetical protein
LELSRLFLRFAAEGGEIAFRTMKTIRLLAAIFATTFSSFAEHTIEDFSPHFSSNTEIIWNAPITNLPCSFWTYRKLPRVFSATTISNAIVLASFQSKGFPQPSTNQVVIWADNDESKPRPPSIFIMPEDGQISYSLGDRAPDSTRGIFKEEATLERAWDCLSQLSIDRSQFVKTNAASYGGWRVFLPRQVDGIQFYGESEGFSFQQFGAHGKIGCFSLSWPNLKREQNIPTASAQQIIACIRAAKTCVIPANDEQDYFARIKNLGRARTLTITKITPYYSEGNYCEMPTNGELSRVVMPLAEMKAIVDFGNSIANVRLVSPIIYSDVNRLLKAR